MQQPSMKYYPKYLSDISDLDTDADTDDQYEENFVMTHSCFCLCLFM